MRNGFTKLLPTLLAGVLAACASTTVTDSWYDESYKGGMFKRVMVLAVTPNIVSRRTFEDIFTAKLRATGIEAVPSYQYLPGAGPAPEPALDAAVAQANADGLLMTHLLRVDRQVVVTPPPFRPGFYGYYSAWTAYPEISTYDIAVAEVNLFDVRTKRLVWGGTTETFNPQSASKDSGGFADAVIAALAKRGLIPAPK
jgi:tellurite resistance protein